MAKDVEVEKKVTVIFKGNGREDVYSLSKAIRLRDKGLADIKNLDEVVKNLKKSLPKKRVASEDTTSKKVKSTQKSRLKKE